MFENLKIDLDRAIADRPGTFEDGFLKHRKWLHRLRILMALNTWGVISHRFTAAVRKVRIPVVRQLLLFVAILFQRWVMWWTGIYIDRQAEIGPGLVVHTPYAVFIGRVQVGANCTLGTGVIINGPVGDNVYFGPGSKLLGEGSVGNNVVVVANSVVLSPIRNDVTVMGIPARVGWPGGRPSHFHKPSNPVN
jgi:serine O-acetyltransferase